MLISNSARTSAFAFLVFMFALSASVMAGNSNKWRIQCSGSADSAGTIVLEITPKGGEPLTVEVAVEDGTSENNVAKQIKETLQEQLPEDGYKVERDDGEDVLVKKHMGAADFELKVVSNSVAGVRLNLDKE